MIDLSLLFYVQRRTGSFEIAGLISAAVLTGVAAGAVVQGRIADRLGPTRPLLVCSAAFAVLVTAGVLAVEAGASTPVMVALGFGIGVTEPVVGSASRALWATLLPPGQLR